MPKLYEHKNPLINVTLEELRKYRMTSEEYSEILKSKGFVYKESQEAWTQHRGQEHKFTHPAFKHYFYVKRISDKDDSPWGFNAQVANGKLFDDIYPHNAVDTFRNKGLFMWVDEAFVELMKRLPNA